MKSQWLLNNIMKFKIIFKILNNGINNKNKTMHRILKGWINNKNNKRLQIY